MKDHTRRIASDTHRPDLHSTPFVGQGASQASDMASSDEHTLSIAAFTALGTIVGYLGTEVASSSMFYRLLWPSRFYNTKSLKSCIAIMLLMPIGGPMHKAAVEVLDKFMVAGLWKGYCRGDMLGTAFYCDSGQHYFQRTVNGNASEKKEARNAFWITVLRLIPWEQRPVTVKPAAQGDNESAAKAAARLRAQRPVFVLKLSKANSTTAKNLAVVDGDVGDLKFRYLAAILASELVTVAVGVVTATLWHSLYAIWYFAPISLKLIALFVRVRRIQVEVPRPQKKLSTQGTSQDEQHPPSQQDPGKDTMILCQVEDLSKGFFLIDGPSEIILQFFRHYGHPVRHHRGYLGDRVLESISIFIVLGAVFIYPGGLIAFIFAPITIQWVWLGYQLYVMLAMHVYRFGDGEHIGTTQQRIASELYCHGSVVFDDGAGTRVLAELQSFIVSSVEEGRREVGRLIYEILGKRADFTSHPK